MIRRKHYIGTFAVLLSICCLFACGEKPKPAVKAAPTISKSEAKRLYSTKCSMCHGTDGKLMVGGAPDLSKSTKSVGERMALIQYGKGLMPPQGEVLSKEEIKAVAEYTLELAE